MRKLSLVLGIVIACLVVLIYLMAFQAEWLYESVSSLGGGIGETIIAISTMILTHPVYITYGLPIGIIIGVGFSWFIAKLVWPRLHRPASTEPVFQQQPTYTPATAQPQEVKPLTVPKET